MRFNLATILALALGTNAALKASEVVSNINELTAKSSDVNDAAKSITSTNAAVKGPIVVTGFKDIIKLVTQDISAMGNEKREVAEENVLVSRKKRQDLGFTEVEQSNIYGAFGTFVEISQDLLSTLLSKQGLLGDAQLSKTISEVLKTLEEGVDTLALGVINLVPNFSEDATKDKGGLDDFLQKAETTFEN